MERIELTVDVSDAVGTGEELRMAVTVVVDPDALYDRPIVFFGFPGGGYCRHYFDMYPAGYSGYSQAEHHARDGHVFVCCDHLGVGDSDVPTIGLDFEAVARANAATARDVAERLAAGDVLAGLGPVEPLAVVGAGQSFGGFALTIGQAVDPCFDGVAMLGWSGIETIPPWPDDVDVTDLLGRGDGIDHPMRAVFHHDDEPEELMLLDMTRGGQVGSPEPWGAQNIPGGPLVNIPRGPLGPGVVAAEAAAITVPVFVGCGEIDVVGDPWAEPTAYRGSRDVTVAIFERMAHMHNFASTRVQLWERLATWADAVAQRRGA
jgi:alpha-beta hydrolase superfamily lysophospholipase